MEGKGFVGVLGDTTVSPAGQTSETGHIAIPPAGEGPVRSPEPNGIPVAIPPTAGSAGNSARISTSGEAGHRELTKGVSQHGVAGSHSGLKARQAKSMNSEGDALRLAGTSASFGPISFRRGDSNTGTGLAPGERFSVCSNTLARAPSNPREAPEQATPDTVTVGAVDPEEERAPTPHAHTLRAEGLGRLTGLVGGRGGTKNSPRRFGGPKRAQIVPDGGKREDPELEEREDRLEPDVRPGDLGAGTKVRDPVDSRDANLEHPRGGSKSRPRTLRRPPYGQRKGTKLTPGARRTNTDSRSKGEEETQEL